MKSKNAPFVFIVLVSVVLLNSCSSEKKRGNSEPIQSAKPEPSKNKAGGSIIVEAPAVVNKPKPQEVKEIAKQKSRLEEVILAKNVSDIRLEAEGILNKTPGDISALNALAISYYFEGNYLRALGLYNVLAVKTKSIEVTFNRGLVYEALGRQEEAVNAYREVLAKEPRHQQSLQRMAQIFYLNADFAKALASLDGIVDVRSETGLQLLYAESLRGMGEKDKANRFFELAYKSQSNNPDVILNYAGFLIDDLQNLEKGRTLLDKMSVMGVAEKQQAEYQRLLQAARAGSK